jgi:aspartate/methionine/tyrosine aminotransferase
LPPRRRTSRFSFAANPEALAVAFPFCLLKLLVRTGLARTLPAAQRLTDGGAAFLHYYGDRVLAAPHADLRAAAALLEPYPADVIDLSAGAPRFDLAPSGSTKLPADRRGWPLPWGLPELRTAVAEKLLTERCLACSPADEVLITHGAAGAFSVTLDAFVNPGARVVLFDPTSPLYALALRPRRARIRWVPTSMEEGRIRFRLDHLDRALRGARLLVLASPANPTGGVFAAEDLEQIAWWAERHDVLIFSDEVFDRYRYEGAAPSIGTLPRAQRRTVTAGSVSKGYALASARVGWLAGCRHLIRPCAVTAAQQAPFVPTLCQQVALAALRQGNEAFAPIRAEFESRRRYGFERLQALGLSPAWPSGAFFFWVPVGQLGMTGRAFAERLLRGKKVAVTPGEWFGPSGSGYVRLSYAAEDGRLREGLGRLGEFVRELQPPKEEAKQAA